MELDFHKYYKHPFSYERVSYQRSRGHSTTIRLQIMVRVFFDFIKFHKSMKNTLFFNKIIDFHDFLCFLGWGVMNFQKNRLGSTRNLILRIFGLIKSDILLIK